MPIDSKNWWQEYLHIEGMWNIYVGSLSRQNFYIRAIFMQMKDEND